MTAARTSALAAFLWLLPLTAEDTATRRIEDRFLAPCCWQQSVAAHDSEAASQMRAEIARLVAAGKSEDQIVDFFVARFGERILREPRGSILIVSIVVPTVASIVAAVCLVAYIRRLRLKPAAVAGQEDLPALPELDPD